MHASGITAEEFTDRAIAGIAGPSIKAWAVENRATFVKIAENAIARNPRTEIDRFCAFIVCTALG